MLDNGSMWWRYAWHHRINRENKNREEALSSEWEQGSEPKGKGDGKRNGKIYISLISQEDVSLWFLPFKYLHIACYRDYLRASANIYRHTYFIEETQSVRVHAFDVDVVYIIHRTKIISVNILIFRSAARRLDLISRKMSACNKEVIDFFLVAENER